MFVGYLPLFGPVLAYERLGSSYVPAEVPISNLVVARGSVLVGNVGIFGVFLRDLPFPQFHPTINIHFSILPLHVISFIHSFRVFFHLIYG